MPSAPVPPAPNILFGEANAHVLFFRWGAAIAVLAGVVGMLRPAFLLPLAYYYILWRHLIGPRTDMWVTDTDYFAMLDGLAFSTIGALLAVTATSEWTLSRFPWLRSLMQDMPAAVLRQKTAGLIWAVVVGAHLGNYFCSGVAKLVAGGSEPWTWLLANPTQTAIVIGMERGDNPLATFPTLLQFSWDTISQFAPGLQLLRARRPAAGAARHPAECAGCCSSPCCSTCSTSASTSRSARCSTSGSRSTSSSTPRPGG